MLLALAALGLPVLTGGRGGIAVFMGPTAGFMYGWLLTPLAYAGITHFLKRDFWLTKAIGMTFGAQRIRSGQGQGDFRTVPREPAGFLGRLAQAGRGRCGAALPVGGRGAETA